MYNNFLVWTSRMSPPHSLFTRPSTLFAFAHICLIWLLHVQLPETDTPKSEVSGECDNASSPILYVLRGFLRDLRLDIRKTLHLVVLNVILWSLLHKCKPSRSDCNKAGETYDARELQQGRRTYRVYKPVKFAVICKEGETWSMLNVGRHFVYKNQEQQRP